MIQAWTVCRNLKQVLVLCHPELAVHGCHVAGLEGWFRSSHNTLCGCCSRLGQQILVMGGFHASDSETWQCWSAALVSVASKLDSLKIEAKKGCCEKHRSFTVHVGHAKAMQDRFLFRLIIGEDKSQGICYMQNRSWGSKLQHLKLMFYEFLMVHCVHERTSTLKTSFPELDIQGWFGGPRFFSRRVEWFCISLSWAIFLECPRM